jgi:DtxR family transcriptional regulator, Mn-dependent transcriptional regulator
MNNPIRTKLSESQEDYLKHIFLLSESSHRVTTQSLADLLKIKPASVTGMIKKLAEVNLISYERYKGVQLTESGEKVAIEVLRHHRLIEMYLAEVLGYSWDEIHDEAERLEHHISEKFEQRIAEKLGHPTHDPHGDPIPDENLQFPDGPSLVALIDLKAGQSGQIKRVRTQDSDALNLLTKLELVIGISLETIEKTKDGVRVALNGERLLVPPSLARQIMVEKN